MLTNEEERILKSFVKKLKAANAELNKKDGKVRQLNFSRLVQKISMEGKK